MATPDAAGTPILEAVHVRPSALVALPPSRSAPRFSHSSSSRSSQSSRSNSSVGGGSARRLAVAAGRRAPSLRRSQAQDSDPCMLGSSFDDWSDGDEEEKQEESRASSTPPTPSRPGVQRSHTEKKPAGMGGGLPPPLLAPAIGSAPSPVAPLTIRVRKFASTSALDPPSTSFAAVTPDAMSSAPSPSDPSPLSTDTATNTRDPVDTALASALEEGRPLERDDELLRASRFDKDELGTARRSGSLPVDTSTRTVGSTAPQPPPAPPPRWFLAWTQNARFRRWYGRILNSYFAFWLVVCSLVVALLEMVLLLTLVVMRHNKTGPHSREEKQPQCHTLTRGSLGPVHYIGAAACAVLALPVLVPVEWLSLYRKRADRRMVRRPYLHVCELFVNAEIGYLLYFFIAHAYRLPFTMECHRELAFSELTFLYATLLLWGVLWWQLVVFCRFLVHLKLQADAANDAIHTSAVSEWLRPPASEHARASTSIHRFKKLLYRAAVRGDLDAVNELVDDASLARYGIPDGARGLRALYDTGPTLWLFAFASSCKNPLHIAAKRGHTAVVRRLLALGLNANALDKVARVNFNIGLLFKLTTRLLLKTQDGSKSPIRAVLCSVLLPPLHGAVAAGHVDVVRLLLEEGGADPNALPRASFYYPSAVIPAIFLADDPEIVKLLVASGANFLHVATTTLSGLASSTYATPLQRSALTQRSATTEYLLASGGDVALTPLHAAAAADNVRTVRRLLRRRSRGSHATSTSVDARGERVEGVQRRTPLHWAAVVGRAAAAKELLERGADPNARDRYGRTPLHWAARNNHVPVVALLLAHGADATAEDDGGVPVLSFAAEAEGVAARVVSALLEHGASLKHQLPASGDTALHVALQRENRETAKSLIRCGADLMASNRDGKRAVDVTSSTRLQFELKKEAGTRDVMISYPHSHFAFAQRVREYLETHGKLTCWMDTMDPSGIGGGAVWREEIARGIHNCSLVVSVVCGGYTTSEWCLKELALAKMIRKPVVALLVEPPTPTPIREDDSDRRVAAEPLPVSPLDALVPPERRLPFHDFVRGTRVLDKRVKLDVDEAALEAAWRTVLPQLRNAMQTSSEHASAGRWLKSQSTASSSQGLSTRGGGEDSTRAAGRPGLRVVGRRLVSQTDSEPEQEDEEDVNDNRDGDRDGDRDASDEERKTETDEPARRARERASPPPSTSSLDVATADVDAALSIAVYSTLEPSALSKRLVRDLSREGFRARALTIPTTATRGEKGDDSTSADSDTALAPLVDKLRTLGALVVVVESLGAERSARDQRQAASAQLARLLRAAATARVAVFPIAARDEFLSFSNLYTLARSELLYFVSGAGEAQATAALLQQLRRSADARRGPE